MKWLGEEERSKNDRYILRALDYPDRPLTECTPESFESALDHLSKSTYNRYRSIIVAVCNHSGHALKLPLKKVKNARLRFLTREEWDRLYLALPQHLKPLAAFSIATGLRQHNVTHLRWDQIDMNGGKMWVHPDEAKGGQAIGIPLSPEATAVLRSQLGKSDEWVFPYRGRGRKKRKHGPVEKIKTAWQLAMERAGLGHFKRWTDAAGLAHKQWVGDFTWHGLRHTWASWQRRRMCASSCEISAENRAGSSQTKQSGLCHGRTVCALVNVRGFLFDAARAPWLRRYGDADFEYHSSNSASALRLATSPGNTFPPPCTHFISSVAAPDQSFALTFRRSVEVCKRPAPRLNVKSTMAASLLSGSAARIGHRRNVAARADCRSCARYASASDCVMAG